MISLDGILEEERKNTIIETDNNLTFASEVNFSVMLYLRVPIGTDTYFSVCGRPQIFNRKRNFGSRMVRVTI